MKGDQGVGDQGRRHVLEFQVQPFNLHSAVFLSDALMRLWTQESHSRLSDGSWAGGSEGRREEGKRHKGGMISILPICC